MAYCSTYSNVTKSLVQLAKIHDHLNAERSTNNADVIVSIRFHLINVYIIQFN